MTDITPVPMPEFLAAENNRLRAQIDNDTLILASLANDMMELRSAIAHERRRAAELEAEKVQLEKRIAELEDDVADLNLRLDYER